MTDKPSDFIARLPTLTGDIFDILPGDDQAGDGPSYHPRFILDAFGDAGVAEHAALAKIHRRSGWTCELAVKVDGEDTRAVVLMFAVVAFDDVEDAARFAEQHSLHRGSHAFIEEP